MSEKAMVLCCSGGVDSTTCLALAVEKHGRGECAARCPFTTVRSTSGRSRLRKAVLEYYGVEGTSLDLTPVFAYSDCSLLSHSTEEVPEESYAEQLKRTRGGKPVTTYVPFRNGLFLSAAASVALSKRLQRDLLRRTSRRCRRQCLSRLQRGIRECDEPLGSSRLRAAHCPHRGAVRALEQGADR